jgi:pimeloyl-ACP methyl ester carboxylesterase
VSAFLSLPDADEVIWVSGADEGVRIPLYRLEGPTGAPAILFGHANGLAAGSYGPWLKALAADAHVFAFDARGHGGSSWPDRPLAELFHMTRFAADLARIAAAVMARTGGKPPLYAGHSLGGSAALALAMAGQAPEWRAFVAFEPPVLPSRLASLAGRENSLIANTEKRRAQWPSREAFFDRLRTTPTFARFDEGMLRAHCQATLRPLPEGGFTLCCPPAVEAAIYRNNASREIWDALARLDAPVEIVSGDPDLPDCDLVTAAMREVAERLRHGRRTVISGAHHMMICEEPDLCRRLLLDRLAQR